MDVEEKEVTEIIELSELGYLLIDCETGEELEVDWAELNNRD